MLISTFASERRRRNFNLRISFVDIKKACFNGIPTRDNYTSVPKEMGLPPGTLAKQVRCVYGTRDAGKIWEDTYTQVLEGAGFHAGGSDQFVISMRNAILQL